MSGFGGRLHAAMTERGRLCVGIDPHAALLEEWGLDATAAGARDFGLRVVDAAAGRVAVVKPQVAFFEQYGSAGFAALEDVLRAAREAGLLVIADAKRGDIGSTMDAYAQAWLAPGSPLEADAVTVSPYLGPDSLRGTIAHAVRGGKGVFVLAATSNPEALGLQSAEVTVVDAERGQTVADWVASHAGAANRFGVVEGDALGPVGFVVGATIDRDELGLRTETLGGAPILAPGFGAQGARLADLDRLFGALAPQVLASASRSILGAGPDGLVAAIDAHNAELQENRRG
ncbi:orotidine-5'-phosphate decarboxylase [Microbacterium saccharophilum]|uniref:Orotidine 5'-phosphate decarboxylase n=1 Tax=Microbacterium saccharophilum TaxID=1213358 RepID=A0A5C8HT16_9MICO|nr:orotidine-5'-phosphate decarboxylase [Microbacterium saccharophilum]TXK09047.1 orotidine-5'-phosphate decarboxylase [Microbacterium saccharophilum]GEP47796.1 orotidine 5'-phosphate decarboxylase [Microbacterium saccharophilum]